MRTAQEYIDLLPGVPIVESPFFEEIRKAGYFTEEEEEIAVALNTKGYVAIDFPDEEFDQRAERIKQNLTPHFQPFLHGENDSGYRGVKIDKVRFQDAFTIDNDVREIAINESILQLLTRLYGRKCFPFQTLNFRIGTQQHIHSDAVHFNCHPERFMCGVWVALEDITPENGPLKYHPGSHKFTDYYNVHIGFDVSKRAHKPSQVLYHDVWNALVEKYQCDKEHFYAKKGQALIWTAHLLHGGETVFDPDTTRWSQVTHYYFENCSYFTPMASDTFAGRILFREPKNILKCTTEKNTYLGSLMDRQYIHSCMQRLRSQSKVVIPKDFNPRRYLELNPDVAQAGADPVNHYLTHGFNEHRRYK